MGRIFFTSDLHFCHNRDFVYEARGFSSIEEHNIAVVDAWNSVIEDDDTVYVLGDLALKDLDTGLSFIEQLKGQIHIIRGNHDTDTKVQAYLELPNVIEVVAAAYLRSGKYTFYLSHYPTLITHEKLKHMSESIINLYGHTHQTTNFYLVDGTPHPYMYHVGVDSHGLKPVLIDDIIEEIKHQLSCNMM